ncbi:MAG: hypothetical protein QOF62_2165 [Pyrinomonadaceae bacterium]|jgi:hypothetical protein|nr:hypothetical protein [Pyrinomonadaceae bacterium]
MSISKPKIFISSTVYDFRDLRSALKYWLEQLGYEVMLSEHNDFAKPLNKNSYDACLKAVERADYFILLVGARAGGFYDASENISITRMEYRTAYSLLKAGKLKLLSFVRSDLWNIKEDRIALRDFLAKDYCSQAELSPSDVDAIANHPSKFVNEAETAFDFLNEISRGDEMARAIQGKGERPIGNWINTFTYFQDIVETLRTEFNISESLTKIALMENLRRELLANLTHLTMHYKGEVHANADFYASAARRSISGNLDSSSIMPGRYLKWLVMYFVVAGSGEKLSTQFVDQALTSGEFLEYDRSLNVYKSGVVNNSLVQLRENTDRLRSLSRILNSRVDTLLEKFRPYMKREENISVNNNDLLTPLAVADCELSIVNLSVALIKALDGDYEKLEKVRLYPSTPFAIEAEKIEKEAVSIDEIANWIENHQT